MFSKSVITPGDVGLQNYLYGILNLNLITFLHYKLAYFKALLFTRIKETAV